MSNLKNNPLSTLYVCIYFHSVENNTSEKASFLIIVPPKFIQDISTEIKIDFIKLKETTSVVENALIRNIHGASEA